MPEPKTKQERLNAMLENGPVRVHVDARKPGVRLPAPHLGRFDVGLNVWMPRGAQDTLVDEAGISETLSFDGRRCRVFVPWESVFSICPTDPITACPPDVEKTVFFPDSVPPELVDRLVDAFATGEVPPVLAEVAEPEVKPKFGLRLVRAEPDGGAGDG